MNYPLVSIVVATLNSERTLAKVLRSVRKQSYPQKKLEILIVDGGSTDSTVKIAKNFGCRVINNPKAHFIYAKQLGFKASKGNYVMFLDSDEVLENHKSIEKRYNTFLKDPNVKVVIGSGYKSPPKSFINNYINDFGDPFSFFLYRQTIDSRFFIQQLKSWFNPVSEDKVSVLFDFSKEDRRPFLELASFGSIHDALYLRKKHPELKETANLIQHLFYFYVKEGKIVGITKNDNVIHNSAKGTWNYLKKLASRIRGNVYRTAAGKGGFLGREKFQPNNFNIKKYLFVFYSLSLILPVIDSLYLLFTRRRLVYVLHPFFCVVIVVLIAYYILIKQLGFKPKQERYGV